MSDVARHFFHLIRLNVCPSGSGGGGGPGVNQSGEFLFLIWVYFPVFTRWVSGKAQAILFNQRKETFITKKGIPFPAPSAGYCLIMLASHCQSFPKQSASLVASAVGRREAFHEGDTFSPC